MSATTSTRKSFFSDRQRTRLNALGRVFAKTDRILTGRREVTVKMSDSLETGVVAPGYSDGTNIIVNVDRIPDVMRPVGLVRLSAVNYHELSHLLFTPRDMDWREKVYNDGAGFAFNVLEDQRIETLFVAKYRPAAKYFTEMNAQLFLRNQRAWGTAFLYTHGRRYMPLEIRAALEASFEGTDLQKREAKKIIDEYRLLTMTAQIDFDRTYDLSIAFQRIIDDLRANGAVVPEKGDKQNGTGTCTDPDKTQPQYTRNPKTGNYEKKSAEMDKGLAEEASEQAEKDTEEQDDTEEEGEDGSGFWEDVLPDEEDEEDGDDEAGSGGGSDHSDDDEDFEEFDGIDGDEGDDDDAADGGSGSSDSDSDDGDMDDDSDSDSAPADGNSHGAGVGVGDSISDADLRELISEVINAVHDSAEVVNDVTQIQQAMISASADLDSDTLKGHERDVHADEAMAALRCEREWARLYADMDPGWRYGSDHGRLSIPRVIQAMSKPVYEDDDVFDEWDEGIEQDAGIEGVIALDISSSMSDMDMAHASSALWIVKKALEAVGAEVSCVAFNDGAFTLYHKTDKAKPNLVPVFASSGGTDPDLALTQGRRVLNESSASNRLLVVITDGQWSYQGEGSPTDETAVILDETDATRVFIGIGDAAKCEYPFAFHHVFNIADPMEIPEKIRLTVTTMLRGILAGRR